MNDGMQAPDSIEPRHLRTAFGHYATGVTVVTTCCSTGKLEGVTVNSFASVSLDPPLVLWSLQKRASSLSSFLESKCFVVNVLASEHIELPKHFATRHPDKFGNITYKPGMGGCPILDNPLAVFECTTESTIDGGDHVVFLGRVRRVSCREGQPLIFSAGTFYTREPLRS
jgi:flavin reductase (DIM6/NTAB) family NADH-FMN oxidoreductase RutF